ncbi:phosphoesterase [Clostridium acetobutylicum]|nr:phosphoesterase [Clostridium acetobutylicum]
MFIDAHNHLDFFEEQEKLNKALDIIKNDNIITIGCSMDTKSYKFTKSLALKNKNIIPCFGIHPSRAHENFKNLECFDEYIRESKIIGEIGLDYVWVKEKEKYPHMKRVFTYFLEEAKKYNKITNIHTKGAESEIYNYIKEYELKTPIIHWYSGDKDTLRKLLDYGCYFTISVDIGYSKLSKEIVQLLPIDKILTETDGPTSLEWVNGDYGYPNVIKNVVKEISKIKNIQEEEVKGVIENNFKTLIRKEGIAL